MHSRRRVGPEGTKGNVVELDDARDEAWLLARERGEAVEHPDPARAHAYERLAAALSALPMPVAPVGWRRRVWASIERAEQERSATSCAAPRPSSPPRTR
jgi:hypothetical protein